MKKILALLTAITLIFACIPTVFAEEVPIETHECEHTFSEWVETVAPTYDTEGEKTRTCTLCGITETETVKKLKKTSIKSCSVSGIKDTKYTGEKILLNIKVKSGKTTLKPDKDYTVKYKNNKNYGVATVTMTGINAYSGKIKKNFKIIPKTPDITGLSSDKTMRMRVNIKHVSDADGYKIKYSTKKDMSNADKKFIKSTTSSLLIRGLKGGKKYYVAVASYKISKGKKIYGKFSEPKSVKVKSPKYKTSSKNIVCLTFDDGPSSNNTPKILDTLKKNNIKATFFIINYSKEDKKIVKRIIDEGHTLAIHCYSHDYDKIYASKDAFMKYYNKLYKKIKKDFGYKVKFMRFPGGSSNTVSCNYCSGVMTQLTKYMDKKGITYFDWNVSSGDAEGVTMSQGYIERNTEYGLCKKTTNVVLMHDSYSKTTTAAALQNIIDYANDHGYVFKPITKSTKPVHHPVAN